MFAVKVFLYSGLYPQSTIRFFLDWEFGNPARSKDQAEFQRVFIMGMQGRPERDGRCLGDLPFREVPVESMREGGV